MCSSSSRRRRLARDGWEGDDALICGEFPIRMARGGGTHVFGDGVFDGGVLVGIGGFVFEGFNEFVEGGGEEGAEEGADPVDCGKGKRGCG